MHAARPFWGLTLALIAGVLLLTTLGCETQAPAPSAGDVAATPPSLQEEAASQVRRVRLDDQQSDNLSVRSVPVRRAETPLQLRLPGEVMPAPGHYALVSAPISGRVVRIYAHEGEAVRRGQVLLELESLEFANLAADYLQALADIDYQTTQVERLETLVTRKISPRSALDKARADLSRAETRVSATYARLRAVGVSDQVLEGWSTTTRERPLLPIYAPISGIIDHHGIDLGQSVTAYQEMLSLIDPAEVLVRGFVAPEEAGYVRPGEAVRITGQRPGVPGVDATVTSINPALDATNKSMVVNVITATRDGWPVPGETVSLEVATRTSRPVLAVPLDAVYYEGERAAVFVEVDGRTFEQRFITLGRIDETEAIVTSGLTDGDRVAVTHVFSLKALVRFSLYGEE